MTREVSARGSSSYRQFGVGVGNVLGRWTSCQLASGLAAAFRAQSVSEKTVLANNVTVLSKNPLVKMRVQHGCGGGTGDGMACSLDES